MNQPQLLNNQNNQYSRLECSQAQYNMQVIIKTNDFSRKQNVHHQCYLPKNQNDQFLRQNRKIELQKNKKIKIENCLLENNSDRCSNCIKWKNWAFAQEKMLLQLEKQIVIKEQKIQQVIQSYKREIVQKANRTIDLQCTLQQKIYQISILEQLLQQTKQKINEFEQRIKVQIASKLQNKIDILTEISAQQNYFQPTSKKDLQNVNKLSNLTTDSIFTIKTEGSHYAQTTYKKKNQKNLNLKLSELQKVIFQNQALKDYNTVLVEKLKMKKYKGYMC